MKNLKSIFCIIILFLFFKNDIYGQTEAFVDNDVRIKKFERDMIMYLHRHKERINIKYPFNYKDYDNAVLVKKRLEFYPFSSDDLLLVQFSINSDHCSRFWGVLSSTRRFFFYDIDDISDSDLLALKKSYDAPTVETILFFCFKISPSIDIAEHLSLASFVYKKELFLIKESIHNVDSLKREKVASAVSFFRRITGISPISNEDKSEIHYLTQQDYTNWLNWYKKNKSILYWDDDEKAKPDLRRLDKVKVKLR